MESADLSMCAMLPSDKIGVRIYLQPPCSFDVYTHFAPHSQIGVQNY